MTTGPHRLEPGAIAPLGLYEQLRLHEDGHGPGIREIRGRKEMLTYLASILPPPTAHGVFAAAETALRSIPLVRDETISLHAVRLVHADGSAREVAIYLPIPLRPKGEPADE